MTGRLKKLNTFVSYPIQLDVNKYCSSGARGTTYDEENAIIPHEYELSGVVVHGGTLHGGHYSAFVRHVRKSEPKTGPVVEGKIEIEGKENVEETEKDIVDWIYISDARVRLASKEEGTLIQSEESVHRVMEHCSHRHSDFYDLIPL